MMSATISTTPPTAVEKRQLWNLPTHPSTTSSCSPITLASGGILTLDASNTVTFTTHVTYQPNCVATDSYFNNTISQIQGYHEPFYASTTVLIYVIATSTVISWFLLTLLLISPGKWFVLGTTSISSWLPGRNKTKSISNHPYILSAGSRPWLQKVAALLVTIALTIASADTFKFASQEFNQGYMDATKMRNEVVGSKEIRVMRVVSDIFIWLAQVQTLIRLFPRRKEKLIIKWFGLLLIVLDAVFSCLNSFYVNTRAAPRNYQDAIPALAYLFELSLSLLYGAWVFYYVATKRRYAFFSTDMPSMTVVALFAIVSIVIPVGFFVADIAVPSVSGWGDFFRWVGAAAASVLVWEWVERIEVLEREEKRDGILGREIYEEDEIGDRSTSSGSNSRRTSRSDDRDIKKSIIRFRSTRLKGISDRIKRQTILAKRPRAEVLQLRSAKLGSLSEDGTHAAHPTGAAGDRQQSRFVHQQLGPNRLDDNGTPSTIYAVHYHPIVDSPAPIAVIENRERVDESTADQTPATTITESSQLPTNTASSTKSSSTPLRRQSTAVLPPQKTGWAQYASNMNPLLPFRRGKKSPPLEIKAAMSLNGIDEPAPTSAEPSVRVPEKSLLKRTLDRLAHASLSNDRSNDNNDRASDHSSLRLRRKSNEAVPPTIIPAPPRGHTWSPDDMRHSPVHYAVRNVDLGQAEHNSTALQGNASSDEHEHRQHGWRSHASHGMYEADDFISTAVEHGDRHDNIDDDDVSDTSIEYAISYSGVDDDGHNHGAGRA